MHNPDTPGSQDLEIGKSSLTSLSSTTPTQNRPIKDKSQFPFFILPKRNKGNSQNMTSQETCYQKAK